MIKDKRVLELIDPMWTPQGEAWGDSWDHPPALFDSAIQMIQDIDKHLIEAQKRLRNIDGEDAETARQKLVLLSAKILEQQRQIEKTYSEYCTLVNCE